jgi:hypothetical protein
MHQSWFWTCCTGFVPMVIEDRKGHETEVFKMKKAILAAQGMEILVTKAKG